MSPLLIVMVAGAAFMALAFWGWSRRSDGKRATSPPTLATALDVFETAVILIDNGAVSAASGTESLAACAERLGVAGAEAAGILTALAATDPAHGARIEALSRTGEGFTFQTRGAERGSLVAEGRSAGALAWIKLSPIAAAAGLPDAQALATLLDSRSDPAWIVDAEGALVWA